MLIYIVDILKSFLVEYTNYYIRSYKMRKIRASKCEIREVPTAEQRAFLNKNHVQGYTPCSLCLGLYLGNELVYLQSYGKTRRSNIDYVDWDMKRMCGPKDAYVYGGASKLLKYFLNNYDLGKGLVTYCDPEVFDGHTYEKIGFTLHHICADDYRYIKDGVEYSKQHGKKSNIWARLKKENPDIEPFDVWKTKHTEREMMEKLGYERVMHKGLISYVIMGEPKWYIYDIEINGYHYVGQHVYYNSLNDNYYGSGIVLKNMQNKYNTKGNKTVLCYGLKNKMAADTAEKTYIEAARKKYGELHKGGKNINIADGGQGGNIAPWTEERKMKISESKKELYNSEKGDEVREKISNTRKEFFDSEDGKVWKEQKSESMKKYIEEHPEFREIAGADKVGKPSWNKGVECTYKEKVSFGLKEYFKEHKQDPKSQPKYRLVRCIETGEEYGQNEWAKMGYSHAGQIARGYGRCKSDHGKHFEFVE